MSQRLSIIFLLAMVFSVGVGFAPAPAMGQVDTRVGLRIGVGSTTISQPTTCYGCGGGRRRGLMAGGYVHVDIPGPFVFQPELLYVQKGTRLTEQGGSRTLNYLEAPLLAKLRLPLDLGAFTPTVIAGPVVGVRVASDVNRKGFHVLGDTYHVMVVPEEARRVEFSLAGGLGGDVRLGGALVSVDARYQWGVTGMMPASAVRSGEMPRNRGLMLSVGLSF